MIRKLIKNYYLDNKKNFKEKKIQPQHAFENEIFIDERNRILSVFERMNELEANISAINSDILKVKDAGKFTLEILYK